LDQFPFREDPVAAARRSIATLRMLHAKLDQVDLSVLRASQAKQDALAAQDFVHRMLLGVPSPT
jgi:xylose isomerase